jgi:hypothetical protein
MNVFTHHRAPGSAPEGTPVSEGNDPSSLHGMAARQGATPPAWLGRSRRELLAAVVGGWRQNRDKLAHLAALVLSFLRPGRVRRRLQRLVELGHADRAPTVAQLLVAGRDQMIVSASAETRVFYRSQGIPWAFHNLRRFVSGPATMLDPIGLFAPRDAIIHHVLQTFHRHPVYDLVLLRALPDGVSEMARQAQQLRDGVHPHQRALASLIEDGAYHARLPADIDAFIADPHAPARAIPANLLAEPHLMLAMDQFKDVRGLVRYAARLQVGTLGAIRAWLAAAFDETVGPLVGVRLGPRHVHVAACDADIVSRYLVSDAAPSDQGPT